jgi:hypothetical protein
MFGVVLRNFVAARHPFRKRVSGCIQSTHFPTGTISSFSQRTSLIHYFRSKTHVWGGFSQFRCRTSPIPKTGVGVHTKHEFLPPEPFLHFSQRTCPIHFFRSKTHVFSLHPIIWEIVENEMHFDSSDNLVFINEQIQKCLSYYCFVSIYMQG